MTDSNHRYGEWRPGHPRTADEKFPKDALAVVYEGHFCAPSQRARTFCGLCLYKYSGSSWEFLFAAGADAAQLEACWAPLPPPNLPQENN
jgi:hypothetical protein